MNPGFLQTAVSAADVARLVTRKWFRSQFQVQSKQDKTPVTIADEETEHAIRAVVQEQHPEHGFFGEETGKIGSDKEYLWVIDPIDGTKCFATGMPTFGTLISLLQNGKPILGVIDHAMLDDRWIGIKGKPTTHNGTQCVTRKTSSLDQATCYTTTTDMFNEHNGKLADQLTRSCQFRVFGGDCLGYGLLASGFNDLVCEADLKPYDYFALTPVIEGAGGMITDWQGNPLTLDSDGDVLAAANSKLHSLAIQTLKA